MTPLHNRPLAALGLNSYRYRCRLGFVMIGAKDDADALREAQRSLTSEAVVAEKLERWDGEKYVPIQSKISQSTPARQCAILQP